MKADIKGTGKRQNRAPGRVKKGRAYRRRDRAFRPDVFPGPGVPHLRLPLQDFEALLRINPAVCLVYMSAIEQRRPWESSRTCPQGAFVTSWSAWAEDLGIKPQTLRAQAKSLRQVGLLRWTKPDKAGRRIFWLPTWPVPEHILTELQAQEEPT